MKELTKEQKVFVLKEMIRYYEWYSLLQEKPEMYYMCRLVEKICYHDLDIDCRFNWSYSYQEALFPEMRLGKFDYDDTWYPDEESIPRLRHCKKVLKLIESK